MRLQLFVVEQRDDNSPGHSSYYSGEQLLSPCDFYATHCDYRKGIIIESFREWGMKELWKERQQIIM